MYRRQEKVVHHILHITVNHNSREVTKNQENSVSTISGINNKFILFCTLKVGTLTVVIYDTNGSIGYVVHYFRWSPASSFESRPNG